jgi:hypothetical protein
MGDDELDEAAVIALLRRAIEEAGTQQDWAEQHNVSAQYVSDVLRGRRDVGPAIAAALGLVEAGRRWRRLEG